MKKFFALLFLGCLFCIKVFAIPNPTGYVNDYAHLLSPNTISTLNQQLKQYELDSSNQVVVGIFPGKLDVPIEDFSVKLEEQWKIGQKNKDNGVILVIFPEEHQLRIEVGYGLEGAIPDALANTIIQQEIVPSFKSGNYDQGVSQGVTAIMQAASGKYNPMQIREESATQQKVTPNSEESVFDGWIIKALPFIIIILVIITTISKIINFFKGRRDDNFNDRNDDDFGGKGNGGGFGGGGGSSGGGGASGRW